MNTIVNDYETELLRSEMRMPLRDLPINPSGISPYPDGSLHCVEAVVEKSSTNCLVLRLRVITNQKRSVRVTVSINSAHDYQRFLVLRHNIRHTDTVFVKLDGLTVSASSNGFSEVYLHARDYSVISDGTDLEIDL